MVKKQKIIILLSIIFGTIIQVVPIIKSGLTYQFGVGFWGPMGHDGVWHLSLSSYISNPFQIILPMYHQVTLQGYHPFYNILVSLFHNLTTINPSILIFQIFPIITSFLFTLLSYKIGLILTNKISGGLFLLLLNSVGNSWGWIISLFRDGTISGESMFWAMQSPSNQINPPFQLSLVLLLVLIYILLKASILKKYSMSWAIVVTIILSVLPITKVYSAPIGFGLHFFYSIYSYVKHKLRLPIFTLGISLFFASLLFLTYNRQSISLLEYHPFWFINSMIESPDRLFIPKLANIRYSLESSGLVGPRLILLQLSTFLVFVIGNFGWRILGFIPTKSKNKIYLPVLYFLISMTILIPTFFIQKGTSWNTIQFLYYGLFLANICTLIFIYSLPKTVSRVLSLTIIVTSFVPLFASFPQYLGHIPPTAIPPQEVLGLDFLKQQPSGIVLTVPYNKYLKESITIRPLPLYAYETTSYVSAYSGHPTFLEDEMNLSNSGLPYIPLLESTHKFFKQLDPNQDRGFLVNNQISYIYLTGKQTESIRLNDKEIYIQEIYNKDGTLIYKVLR